MESIITDLTVYQLAWMDLDTLTQYRGELRAGASLSGLKPELSHMIRGQVLAGSRVMPIDEIFSAAIRVHDSVPPSSISSLADASALVMYQEVHQSPVEKGLPWGSLVTPSLHTSIVGKCHIKPKNFWKEFGKPAWVLATYRGKTPSVTSSTSTASMPAVPVGLDYQISVSSTKLANLQASRASVMHTFPSASTSLASLATSRASYAGEHVSTPGMTALSASPMSWIIDSRAMAHMTGTPSIQNSYHPDPSIADVHIVDGRPCHVKGSGITRATSTLPLHNVLYVPDFPTNLLSISAITKALNCGVFCYPHHCIF